MLREHTGELTVFHLLKHMFVLNRVESAIQVSRFAIRFVGISLPTFTQAEQSYLLYLSGIYLVLILA